MSDPSQSPNQEDRLRLSSHRLLHDLTEDSREALIDRFQVGDVATGQPILEEGQANSRLFVVLKGSVSVQLPKRASRVSEVKLATLATGEIFGEYSLFDGQPVSATVYAKEAARVAWLDKRVLDDFVDAHREVGRLLYESIARILISRLREKNSELDVISIG